MPHRIGVWQASGTDLGEVIKEESSYYSDDCVLMSGLESGE